MKPSLLLAMILPAALLPACGLFEPAQLETQGPKAVAHLEKLQGRVVLERGGVQSTAALGYLFLKDALETSADAGANIRFPDGRVLEVGPDARFLIDERGDGLVLEVSRGLVISRVPMGGGGAGAVSLQILTPFGITRVADGPSEVQVSVGPDSSQVNVVVGSVEFLSRNGEPTEVRAGETLALAAGKQQLSGRAPPEPGTRSLELEPIEVVIFASSGKVELKKKDQKRWGGVSRTGDALGSGDAIRVGKGRSLISLGSGSRVWLEQDSEALFTGSGQAGGEEQTGLELKKGAATLSLAPGQASRVRINDLSLHSTVGGQFGVARTQEGYEVSAVTGEVVVARGGVEQKVQAGQTARLGKPGASVQVATEERTELQLPSRAGLKVFHPGLAQATLTWVGPTERSYRVEVAPDPAFTDKLIAGEVGTNFLNVPLPRRGNLYWRIFQQDGTTPVDQGSAFFSPEPAMKDLARLRNEVPENGEKTTIFYQDKLPAVTFTYPTDPKAARYKVVVFRSTALDKPVAEKTVSQGQLALEAGALVEGSYVWSATPVSPSGEELRGGRMNKLELIYDNSVPNLVVRSPKNGQVSTGSRVQVQGVAPVGARLLVNGRSIELDEKNRFDAQVAVSGRQPQVVFRLSRPGAADVFTVRTLKRAR